MMTDGNHNPVKHPSLSSESRVFETCGVVFHIDDSLSTMAAVGYP